MSGIVLNKHETDYGNMSKAGRVVIEFDSKRGAVITVDGFEFGGSETCRTHVTKAMAWARDVLGTAVHADRLVPGGNVISRRGIDQDELEAG